MATNNSINSAVTQGMHAAIVGNKYTLSNLRNASKYVVSSGSGEAGYTTIQAAINQAVSDGANATTPAVIWIFSGSYNEDLTLHPYVNLSGSGAGQSVMITGNAVYTGTGNFSCINLTMTSPNGSAALSLQGSDTALVDLHFLYLDSGASDGIAFECTGSGITANLLGCTITAQTGGLCKNITDGTIEFFSGNSVGVDQQSIMTGGQLLIFASDIRDSISMSTGGTLFIFQSYLAPPSGSFPCISIGSGCSAAGISSSFNATNDSGFFVEGAGTFDYSTLSTFGSSVNIQSSLTTNSFPLGGHQTISQQPAFSAYLSATQTNVTGDGTDYTLIADTVLFDKDSNYDNTTGIFTAPVQGVYQIDGCVTLGAGTIGTSTLFQARLVTTGGSYFPININPLAGTISGGLTQSFSFKVYMSASDTAYIVITVTGAGAKTVSVAGNFGKSFFSGALLN